MQPFTRYSRKEKPEVPKCQMLAANILKQDKSWLLEDLDSYNCYLPVVKEMFFNHMML